MTVMIVDDNPRIREMIKQIIQDVAEVICECSDGTEAVLAFPRLHPDIVLMDMKMKQMDGITAARQIKEIDPDARIIIVSDYGDEPFRLAAAKAGVAGYVLKEQMTRLPEIMLHGDPQP